MANDILHCERLRVRIQRGELTVGVSNTGDWLRLLSDAELDHLRSRIDPDDRALLYVALLHLEVPHDRPSVVSDDELGARLGVMAAIESLRRQGMVVDYEAHLSRDRMPRLEMSQAATQLATLMGMMPDGVRGPGFRRDR